MVLEMDVAQVNPYESGHGEPPVHMAWFAPRRLTAVTNYRGAEVCLFSGGRRPPGPDNGRCRGMGDDVGREQKEGSVDSASNPGKSSRSLQLQLPLRTHQIQPNRTQISGRAND